MRVPRTPSATEWNRRSSARLGVTGSSSDRRTSRACSRTTPAPSSPKRSASRAISGRRSEDTTASSGSHGGHQHVAPVAGHGIDHGAQLVGLGAPAAALGERLAGPLHAVALALRLAAGADPLQRRGGLGRHLRLGCRARLDGPPPSPRPRRRRRRRSRPRPRPGPGRSRARIAAGRPCRCAAGGRRRGRRARARAIRSASSPPPRASAMAAAEGVRNRMCWQRLSMVGSRRARSWQTSTNTAYSGGSSSDFSSALAASRPIVSASRIRYARRGASNGRRCRSLRSSRIWSIRIASPSGSTTNRSGCCSVSTRCSSVPSSVGDEGVRRVVLARAARPVQQVRVARIGGRQRQQAAGLGLAERLTHRAPSRPGRRRSRRRRRRRRPRRAPARRGDGGERRRRRPRGTRLPRSRSGRPRPPPAGCVTRMIVRSGSRPSVANRLTSRTVARAETAPAALEGDGRVDVAVADHPGAAGQRRRDHVGHQLRAAGGEQQRLGARADVPVAVVEHERPDALAERRAAGLAALDHLVAGGTQTLRQQAGLRRLADAVEALEGDEHRTKAKGGRGNLPNQLSVSHPEQVIRLDTGAFRAARTARAARGLGVLDRPRGRGRRGRRRHRRRRHDGRA